MTCSAPTATWTVSLSPSPIGRPSRPPLDGHRLVSDRHLQRLLVFDHLLAGLVAQAAALNAITSPHLLRCLACP